MRQQREDKTVGFRLGGKHLAELERQARTLGVSPGELARAVLERHLKRDETRAILEAIGALSKRHEALLRGVSEAMTGLEDELSGLRQDFNLVVKKDHR